MYVYKVKCEGKEITTEFCYGGLKEAQKFIQDNGKPNKQYKIRVVKENTNEE